MNFFSESYNFAIHEPYNVVDYYFSQTTTIPLPQSPKRRWFYRLSRGQRYTFEKLRDSEIRTSPSVRPSDNDTSELGILGQFDEFGTLEGGRRRVWTKALRTDRPTDRRTDTHIEMHGRIYKTDYVQEVVPSLDFLSIVFFWSSNVFLPYIRWVFFFFSKLIFLGSLAVPHSRCPELPHSLEPRADSLEAK